MIKSDLTAVGGNGAGEQVKGSAWGPGVMGKKNCSQFQIVANSGRGVVSAVTTC